MLKYFIFMNGNNSYVEVDKEFFFRLVDLYSENFLIQKFGNLEPTQDDPLLHYYFSSYPALDKSNYFGKVEFVSE